MSNYRNFLNESLGVDKVDALNENWNYVSNELDGTLLPNMIYFSQMVKEVIGEARMNGEQFGEIWSEKAGNYRKSGLRAFIEDYEKTFKYTLAKLNEYADLVEAGDTELTSDPREGSGPGNRSRSA